MVAAEYRSVQWAKIINNRNESGLSIKAFCESAGIRENCYYYWQKKLRETAYQELANPQSSQNLDIVKNETIQVPDGWVVYEKKQPQVIDALTVEIGSCRITVANDINVELFAKVCKVLVGL